jgi:hypothetical protein
MCYSIRTRSRGYRFGYTGSPDGKAWSRLDDLVDLDTSPDGWDSEMIVYSALFPLRPGSAMAYNGNDYERSSFDVAGSTTVC